MEFSIFRDGVITVIISAILALVIVHAIRFWSAMARLTLRFKTVLKEASTVLGTDSELSKFHLYIIENKDRVLSTIMPQSEVDEVHALSVSNLRMSPFLILVGAAMILIGCVGIFSPSLIAAMVREPEDTMIVLLLCKFIVFFSALLFMDGVLRLICASSMINYRRSYYRLYEPILVKSGTLKGDENVTDWLDSDLRRKDDNGGQMKKQWTKTINELESYGTVKIEQGDGLPLIAYVVLLIGFAVLGYAFTVIFNYSIMQWN